MGSHHRSKFSRNRHSGRKDVFSLSRDFERPRDQRGMCLYGLEPLNIIQSLVAIGIVVVEICF